MKKKAIIIGNYLIGYLTFAEAHVADFHLNTIEEREALSKHQEEKENEKALEVLNSSDSSQEEKINSLETLVKNNKVI